MSNDFTGARNKELNGNGSWLVFTTCGLC